MSTNEQDPYRVDPQGPAYGQQAVAPTAPGAVGSMICGILGLWGCPLLAIPAVVMGHKAQGRIRHSNGAFGGEGKALTGLVTGYIGLVMSLFMIIPVMAAIFVPAVAKVIADAKVTEMKSNGKNLYVAVFADAIDTKVVGFPAVGTYPTSTAFFKALTGDNPSRENILPITPDFLAGPHVEPATAWTSFGARNNGWCAVEGLSESSDVGIPFLISSNIKARNLSELRGRVGDSIATTTGVMRRKVVVVTTGGRAEVLSADDTWQGFDWPDLKILHP